MTRIADLAVTSEITPSDVMILSDGQLTKKISVENFKTALLNKASKIKAGIVRCGPGLDITADGLLSVKNYSAYTLPAASEGEIGGVKVGTGLRIDAGATLHATYVLPTASDTVTGGVRIGQGFLLENGVLSVNTSDRNKFLDGLTIGVNEEVKMYIGGNATPQIRDFNKGIVDISVKDVSSASGFAGVRLISALQSSSLNSESIAALVPTSHDVPVNLGITTVPWSTVFATKVVSNVEGDVVGNTTGQHTGNVVAFDNTVAYDASTKTFNGNFVGAVGGNAMTASRFQNSRRINNVQFDGTADITIYDNTRIEKAGDTMTGPLTLSGAPVGPLHAANKSYIDSADALRLPLTGGILSGFLTLSDAPQQGLHAATKDYVDGSVATRLALSGGVMSGLVSLSDDPTQPLHAATKRYVENTADSKIDANNLILRTYIDQQDATKLNLSGGTMTGRITLNANPLDALHATPKQYVDSGLTDLRNYTNSEILDLRNYTVAEVSSARAFTTTSVNTLDTVLRTYIDAKDNTKLNLSGGTMTGRVLLSADPTSGLHAATKQYVDTADTNLGNILRSYTDTQIANLSAYDTYAHGAKSPRPNELLPRAIRGFSAYNSTDFPGNYFGGLTVTGASGVYAGQLAFNWNSEEASPSGLYFRTNDDTGVTTEWSAWSQIATMKQVDDSTANLTNLLRAYVDSRDSTKVNISGSSMTGYLTLAAHPSSAMHAATKYYVDVTRPAQVHATYGSTALSYYSNSYFDIFPPAGYSMGNLIAFMPAFASTGSTGSYYYNYWYDYNYYYNYNNGEITWSALGDRVRVYLSGNYYYYYYYYYNYQRINWMAIWR